ncbi:unnamed protein product [Eretmochelys imbricata]
MHASSGVFQHDGLMVINSAGIYCSAFNPDGLVGLICVCVCTLPGKVKLSHVFLFRGSWPDSSSPPPRWETLGSKALETCEGCNLTPLASTSRQKKNRWCQNSILPGRLEIFRTLSKDQ